MIIVVLLLILLGSVCGAVLGYGYGGSWGIVILAYIGGGWAGLLTGLPLLFLVRWRNRRRAERMACPGNAAPEPDRSS